MNIYIHFAQSFEFPEFRVRKIRLIQQHFIEFAKWGYKRENLAYSPINGHNSKSRRASTWIKSLSIQPRNPEPTTSQLSPYLPSISTIITFQPTSRPPNSLYLSLSLSLSPEREVKPTSNESKIRFERKSINSRNNSNLCTNDPDEIMNGTKPSSLDSRSNILFLSLSLSFNHLERDDVSRTTQFSTEKPEVSRNTFPFRRQTIPLGRLELNSCWIDPRRWRSLSRIVVDRFVRTFADPFPRIRIVGASRTSFLSSTSYRLSVAGENFPRERARSSYFLRGRRIFQKMARMFESSCLWSPIENNIWISSILKMELLESCK